MGSQYRKKSFMAGRNGADSLFYCSFVLYLTLFGLNLMLHSMPLYYINICLLILSVFRFMSKNIAQRKKEAAVCDRIISYMLPNSSQLKRRLLESRTHTFHECKYCGSTLRVEKRRGKFNIICPKCKNRITVRNWL